MRILKTKIALSSQSRNQQFRALAETSTTSDTSLMTPPPSKSSPGFIRSRAEPRERKKTSLKAKSTKTVVKNYGKAIASFAMTPIAVTYLVPMLDQEANITLNEFVNYMSTAKESIEGIDTFRALLLIADTDDEKIASYKRIFKAIAEVFVKYFSVNWIFSGRMKDKEIHLKLRFKMLRRIQNPEQFTYLK